MPTIDSITKQSWIFINEIYSTGIKRFHTWMNKTIKTDFCHCDSYQVFLFNKINKKRFLITYHILIAILISLFHNSVYYWIPKNWTKTYAIIFLVVWMTLHKACFSLTYQIRHKNMLTIIVLIGVRYII